MVSYRKKVWFTFVSYFLHGISIPTSAAAAAAATAYRLLSTFFSLSSLSVSTARSLLGWAPGLLCPQHRTCASTPALVLRFASTPVSGVWELSTTSNFLICGSLWSRHLRELLSYQNPHRSNQLWQGFVRVSYLVLEHTAPGLGDSQDYQLFSNRPPTVRFLGCRVLSSVFGSCSYRCKVYDPLVSAAIPPSGWWRVDRDFLPFNQK